MTYKKISDTQLERTETYVEDKKFLEQERDGLQAQLDEVNKKLAYFN